MKSFITVVMLFVTSAIYGQERVRVEVTIPKAPPVVQARPVVVQAPPVVLPPVVVRETIVTTGYVQMPKYRLVRDEPDYWYPGKVIFRPWRR